MAFDIRGNSMARDFNTARIVKSVPEEYAIIDNMNCGCGGKFQVLMQSLIENENKFYDVLKCKCLNCGGEEEFIFDINSFFGKWG